MASKYLFTAMFAAVLILSGGNCFSIYADPGDACSLVTQDQAGNALGVKVAAGQREVSNDPKSCSWTEVNATPVTLKKISLAIITTDSFTSEKTPIDGFTKTPVAGLGDEAYYVTSVIEGTTLYVKKGGQALTVSVTGHAFSTDQLKAMEKTLAQNAVAKL